jgi:hypothetical protein
MVLVWPPAVSSESGIPFRFASSRVAPILHRRDQILGHARQIEQRGGVEVRASGIRELVEIQLRRLIHQPIFARREIGRIIRASDQPESRVTDRHRFGFVTRRIGEKSGRRRVGKKRFDITDRTLDRRVGLASREIVIDAAIGHEHRVAEEQRDAD